MINYENQIATIFLNNADGFTGKIEFKERLKKESWQYHRTRIETVESTDEKNSFEFNFKKNIDVFEKSKVKIWDVRYVAYEGPNIKKEFFISVPNELNEHITLNKKVRINLFKNAGGTITFNVKNDVILSIVEKNKNIEKNKAKIKIGVIGTCFSRSMFSSGQFFNPGYKELYECTFTQFHSSLFSLTSKPVNLPVELFSDRNEAEKGFIEREFKKTTYKKLEESKAEYVVIDNYIDASQPILKVDEDTYLTINTYLNNSNYLENHENKMLISRDLTPDFFELWTKKADLFMMELKKIIPENKIILTKANIAEKRYTADRKSTEYYYYISEIKKNNYYWELMDNYIIDNYKEVQILDMTNTKFIGDPDHPLGNYASHYESGWYKEQMNKLNASILKDKS